MAAEHMLQISRRYSVESSYKELHEAAPICVTHQPPKALVINPHNAVPVQLPCGRRKAQQRLKASSFAWTTAFGWHDAGF
jgi:hypothetical protein